jgi:HD-GYP domain-containing protein (c-di-GMP phosphodiesterase class II)
MACDHAGFHTGGARYMRDGGELRLVLVCDACGAERGELNRIEYRPNARGVDGQLVELTANRLGLNDGKVERVRLAALLCDIGRDQISPEILTKRGPLDDQEWAEIRRQPELGAALLSDVSFDDIREWILCHHERPDGRGYPRGLAGERIPLEARIVAVVEAYAAMTSERPYSPALDHAGACEELRRCAGTQFDAEVVEAFLAAAAELRPSRQARPRDTAAGPRKKREPATR